MIPDLAQSTACIRVRRVRRTFRSALVTLVTSSWQFLSSTSVCKFFTLTLDLILTGSGFVVKIKKILETICHNCGLVLADYVSLRTLESSGEIYDTNVAS